MEVKGSVTAAIAIVVVTIVLLALTPVIASQVDRVVTDANMNAPIATRPNATMWNFTGASGALSILGLVPFVWVAAVLLCAVAGMWRIVGGKKD